MRRCYKLAFLYLVVKSCGALTITVQSVNRARGIHYVSNDEQGRTAREGSVLSLGGYLDSKIPLLGLVNFVFVD